MLKINELKDALKQINIGNAFSQFMPRAYYNMDDDSIIVCDLEIMTEFNNRYLQGELDEEYINSTIKTKALSEIYPNFFFIDCYISKDVLIKWCIDKISDIALKEELNTLYFKEKNKREFKKLLIEKNVFDKFQNLIDDFYEEEAINWCLENTIPYEV